MPQHPVDVAVIGNACEGLDLKDMQIYYSGTNAQAQQANCGEQACPALGCEAALKPHTAVLPETMRWDYLGGASHPNAGQACSPQQPVDVDVIGNACDGLDLKGMQIHYSGTNAQAQQDNCGEQACPALGCEAALKPHTAVCLKRCGGIYGGASHPNAGQACSPRPGGSPEKQAVVLIRLTCDPAKPSARCRTPARRSATTRARSRSFSPHQTPPEGRTR